MSFKWRQIKLLLLENKLSFLLIFTPGICSSIITVLIPVSIGKYFDLVFEFNSHRAMALDLLPFTLWDTMPRFLFFFFGLVILKILADFIQRFSMGKLGELFVKQIREDLFQKQLGISAQIYDQKGIGRYLLRYSGDLNSIRNYFTTGIVRFTNDIILLCLTLSVILILDSSLFFAVLLFIPVILFCIFLLNKALYTVSARRRDTRSGLLSFVTMRLRAMITIKTFNKEIPELNKFKKRSTDLLNDEYAFQRIYSLMNSLIPGFIYMLLGVIMVFVFIQKTSGTAALNQGALLASFLLIITVLPVFRRTLRVSMVWKLGDISFSKLAAIFDLEDEKNADQPDFNFQEGKVQLDNISFAYHENEPVFKNLTVDIAPHTITLITGDIGTGKTTLIKLLTGVYQVNQGEILIDGQNIEHVNPKSLRKNISLISDSWPLLGKTVFEAISYSRKSEKREVAQKMLDKMQTALPDKTRLTLDDMIGDLASNLSKGQVKLLSYARAFLTGKSIILIDSPFMGLDVKSSALIAEHLIKLKKKRTLLIFNQENIKDKLQPDLVIELGNCVDAK